MNFLQILLALLQLAPSIIATVSSVEGLIGHGKGATKKALVMAAVMPAAPPKLITEVGSMIDRSVKAMNDGKVFAHAGVPAEPMQVDVSVAVHPA